MQLSEDGLAEVVGMTVASRSECIKELWAYLKRNNLQDPENKQFFFPDTKMAKIFGTDRMRASQCPNTLAITYLVFNYSFDKNKIYFENLSTCLFVEKGMVFT